MTFFGSRRLLEPAWSPGPPGFQFLAFPETLPRFASRGNDRRVAARRRVRRYAPGPYRAPASSGPRSRLSRRAESLESLVRRGQSPRGGWLVGPDAPSPGLGDNGRGQGQGQRGWSRRRSRMFPCRGRGEQVSKCGRLWDWSVGRFPSVPVRSDDVSTLESAAFVGRLMSRHPLPTGSRGRPKSPRGWRRVGGSRCRPSLLPFPALQCK
jgi:hypothetical protein